MALSHVRVLTAGLLTTVQDRGRWGWQSAGVSVSGPMDPRALRLSNAMVGNSGSAAALEVTLLGPEIEFDDHRIVAVCGAEFALSLGSRQLACGKAFSVRAGERLRLGARGRGARAYLAVSGGFAVPELFGSRSTHVASRLGGHHGRPLVRGDAVPLGQSMKGDSRGPEWVRSAELELPSQFTRLRVLPSPQAEPFTGNAMALLQSADFVVGRESDRMGYRLEGPSLEATERCDGLSSPTVLGALQIPPDGHPILLMADRQTTGGYPTIATVISADIGLAGQLAPGDRLSFEICSHREALAALIAQERRLMAVESMAGR